MEIKTYFWDFDGVLLNSNEVRDQGFIQVLNEYPEEQVEKLLKFHRENGGLSRYVKFRYFFETIRGEKYVNEDKVNLYASRFSDIMIKLLVKPELLIEDTLQHVKRFHKLFNMHIVSGSDQNELRYLCKELKISQFFNSIHGSPKPKTKWVGELIEKHCYNRKSCILIGDSKNDYDAAFDNEIRFVGFGNDKIIRIGDLKWHDLRSGIYD